MRNAPRRPGGRPAGDRGQVVAIVVGVGVLALLAGAAVWALTHPSVSLRPVTRPGVPFSSSPAQGPTDFSVPGSSASTAGPGSSTPVAASPAAGPDLSPAPSALASTAPPATPRSSAGPVPDCLVRDLTVSASTDKTTPYLRGESIKFTLSATNTSAHPCQANENQCTDRVLVRNSNGITVWSSTAPGAGACVYTPTIMQPGQSVSFTYTWDQAYRCGGGCPSGQVPSGTYSYAGYWPTTADGTAASATRQLTIA